MFSYLLASLAEGPRSPPPSFDFPMWILTQREIVELVANLERLDSFHHE